MTYLQRTATPTLLYFMSFSFLSSSYRIVSLTILMKVKLKWVDVDEISFFVGIKRNFPFPEGHKHKTNMRIERVYSFGFYYFAPYYVPFLCLAYHTLYYLLLYFYIYAVLAVFTTFCPFS